MASFHSSAPAPKKNSRAKKLGSGSKIENQSQKARLWLQNKTNQSQKLSSGSRIFLRLDHQWPKCYIAIGNVCVILNHYQSITYYISPVQDTCNFSHHNNVISLILIGITIIWRSDVVCMQYMTSTILSTIQIYCTWPVHVWLTKYMTSALITAVLLM